MYPEFRPSAIPLITCDPYFSVWSFADTLTDDATRHWTGRRAGMVGMLLVDGTPYRFLGRVEPNDFHYFAYEAEALHQTSLRVLPTATVAVMENEIVELTLTFRTPLLLDDPALLSRPVSYLSYSLRFKDGCEHKATLYFDITPEHCVSDNGSRVCYEKTALGYRVGRVEQKPLNRSGDDVTIDWGYLHLAHPEAKLSNLARREHLSRRKSLSPIVIEPGEYTAHNYVTLAVETEEREGVITLAYDDLGKSIRYFDEELPAYCMADGATFDEILADSVKNYASYTARAERFDAEMTEEMRRYGDGYAEIGALVYRQAIAAHKPVKSEKDGLLFLSKECFSNGCIATLDVTYPSIPLFLRYNTAFVRGMMAPIFRYAASEEWCYDFAPHDCGQYPLATGQVYGKREGKLLYEMQMPVEECGNALLTVAAVCFREGSDAYAREHEEILTAWAEYLLRAGYDPENQLCTDDFAGKLARNCNLTVKAIVALGAYGKLLGIQAYTDAAHEMAARFVEDAKGGLGTTLTFDGGDTWSLKYNLVWDKLFSLGLFPEELYDGEVARYRAEMRPYGIPLDSRKTYTKLDWEMWTTALTDDPAYRAEVVAAIRRFVCESPCRVPVSDWYETTDARQVNFQNRTVLGGFFIPQIVGLF